MVVTCRRFSRRNPQDSDSPSLLNFTDTSHLVHPSVGWLVARRVGAYRTPSRQLGSFLLLHGYGHLGR